MLISKVTPNDVILSLNSTLNRKNVFKAGQGAGASGSFFFFSEDKRFIIKSLQGQEKNILINMLPDLTEHFKEFRESLISKVFGIF